MHAILGQVAEGQVRPVQGASGGVAGAVDDDQARAVRDEGEHLLRVEAERTGGHGPEAAGQQPGSGEQTDAQRNLAGDERSPQPSRRPALARAAHLVKLPEGLSLDVFNERARIVGVPTEAGSFSFTVTATDSDGFTDEITIGISLTVLDALLLPFDQEKCNSSNTNPVAYLEVAFAKGEGSIDWGDGSPIERFQAADSPIVLIHEYDNQTTGASVLTLSDGIRHLTRLQVGRDRPRTDSCFTFDVSNLWGAQTLSELYVYPPMKITGTVENLPISLSALYLGRGNSVAGDVKDLPRSLTQLDLYQTGALLTGDVNALPRSLTHLYLGDFNNVVGGDIGDLPQSLIEVTFYGRYTVSGDVSELPRALKTLTFGLESSDSASGPRVGTVTGDVMNLPRGLTEIIILSVNNQLMGDIANLPPSLTNLRLWGENKVLGDVTTLPRSLTYMDLQGENEVLGDVKGLPDSLTHLSLRGNNKVTGNIADLPESLTTIQLHGRNSVSGDLGQLKINDAITIDFRGDNHISDFALNPAWNPTPNPLTPQGGFGLYLGGNSALEANEVDRLLQFLSDKLPPRFWTPAPTIGILGASSPRTPASDSAVSVLEDNLYRVLTNE